MEALGSFGSQEKSQKYYCEICDYRTCNKFDFNKHNKTYKHKIAILEVNGSRLS